MPAADPRRVKQVFGEALEIADADARRAFLDRRCGDDADLRRRLDALLAAHDAPASALEKPLAVAAETATVAPPAHARDAGTVLAGRYKLLEPIGEGGMGQVWVADQLTPIRRRVAVKVVKPGMDSRAVLARFEAERQALALMDHPNIAKVLDAGTAEDGRPFFVMELVKGVPITEFCDARRLSPRERLALFVPVCAAVQHAHQKGIIHRDLKPSNVLVALHDDEPVPKVIDFGVAKAIGGQLTDKTVYTGFGALVGTPAYMAPEQATLNQLDVDTRTDVYALGVLLYELLAGSPPFEPERLKKAALDEVLRLVREEEPPRPSARLSTSGRRASLAAVRRSDPDALSRLIRGELDWIVMKALEKDRNRRYDTAANFAADVRRYLDGDAVHAHPPGAVYRFRKFARKHRAAFTTTGLFAALLVTGALVSTWLAVRATRAEREAAVRAAQANALARRAEVARQEAEHNAASLRVDLDLNELRTDKKVGLLRLAQTLRSLPADETPLREFVTLAILATGQEFAPLLPPITHDGDRIEQSSLAPDKRTLLTRSEDGTARLGDVLTARPIAALREGTERAIAADYSPDGRTIYTLDEARVARFWNAPAGTFRARTSAPILVEAEQAFTARVQEGRSRPAERAYSPDIWLGNHRLLVADSYTPRTSMDEPLPSRVIGPLELWDVMDGRRAGRIEEAGEIKNWRPLLEHSSWILYVEDPESIQVYRDEDGQRAATLVHPEAQQIAALFTDAEGRHITTVVRDASGYRVRIFDSDMSFAETAAWSLESDLYPRYPTMWWTDTTLAGMDKDDVVHDGQRHWALFRVGQPRPFAQFISEDVERTQDPQHYAILDGCALYELPNRQRLVPPAGRKYHPALSRFAPDGRFVSGPPGYTELIVDTLTEKAAPNGGIAHALPGFGFISEPVFPKDYSRYALTIRIVPGAGRLNLPPDLLELWAQVAVRGELGPDGQLVPWDEPTWQRKRQELAARPAPRGDVPFPGHLANDSLHWLRGEYEAAGDDAARLRLASELLRRAEGMGDRAEAARWRDEVARLTPKPEPQPEAK
jgi:tRNA A-37 threonylcarbamoyl transferase component Bud32